MQNTYCIGKGWCFVNLWVPCSLPYQSMNYLDYLRNHRKYLWAYCNNQLECLWKIHSQRISIDCANSIHLYGDDALIFHLPSLYTVFRNSSGIIRHKSLSYTYRMSLFVYSLGGKNEPSDALKKDENLYVNCVLFTSTFTHVVVLFFKWNLVTPIGYLMPMREEKICIHKLHHIITQNNLICYNIWLNN